LHAFGEFLVNIGPFQILIIALVILVLFGRGRISEMMGDFGKGVKSFRQGLNEDDAHPAKGAAARIEGPVVHDAKPASEAPVEIRPADKTVG
jgi:sec-independent protein translocase protein TatA